MHFLLAANTATCIHPLLTTAIVASRMVSTVNVRSVIPTMQCVQSGKTFQLSESRTLSAQNMIRTNSSLLVRKDWRKRLMGCGHNAMRVYPTASYIDWDLVVIDQFSVCLRNLTVISDLFRVHRNNIFDLLFPPLTPKKSFSATPKPQ